jgi:peptidoglycan/xylan/chitin deacetylase (PgdA/CDA1 family)
MKLCLCFHCLCESYDDVSGESGELYVSLDDMQGMIEQFLARGYRFSDLADPADNTVTITFDDGYANNLLFSKLAQEYEIPYIVFVSAYYTQTGAGFPWMDPNQKNYEQMYQFDYYSHHENLGDSSVAKEESPQAQPMTYEELKSLTDTGLMEIGCHGYYHQPLSKEFEGYTEDELSRSMSVFNEHLNVNPRYFALANGMYTGRVVRDLLKTFDKVLTIDGTAFRAKDKVVHRLSLTSPDTTAPLSDQIDKSMRFARQVKRAIRTRRRLF